MGQAVLAEERVEPYVARRNARLLNALPMERLTPVALAATRVRNILKAGEATRLVPTAHWRSPLEWLSQVQPALFQHEEERVLHQITGQLQERDTEAVGQFHSDAAFSLLEALTEPVNRFFDAVLVMAPDEAIRRNRLLLLAGVDSLYRSIGDFSRLVV